MRPWPLATFAYLIGAIVFLWPMPASLNVAIWGDRFDAWTTLWLIDHLGDRISAGDFSSTTTEILYPLGYNLWSFGHMALQAIGGALVALGIPLVATYNLLLISAIWTSALAAHALGHGLTGSHRAGAVSGIVFASSPYLYAEGAAGCIELVAAGLLPLHALSLICLLRSPTWKRFAISTGLLALIGPFNWYYTLFAGLFAAGFGLWQAMSMGLRRLTLPSRSTHRRGLLMLLGSLVLAAAIDLPLITEARRETPTRPGISHEIFQSSASFMESRLVTNGSMAIEDLTEDILLQVDALQVHFNSTSVVSLLNPHFDVNPLGVTPGALAYCVGFLALFAGGRRTWGWLVLAGGATVLTLGPYLNLSGHLMLSDESIQWPLPYFYAYEHLPFFSKAYRPYRIGIIALQCLAAAGAVGTAVLVRSLNNRWTTIAVVALGFIGFSQPHWAGEKPAERPLADARIPAAYVELATLDPGAVIEVPIHYQPVSSAHARGQYYQTAHKHPMLNTNQLIRRPDLLRFRELVVGNSFLHSLANISRTTPPYTIDIGDIKTLKEQGFRWLIAHKRIPADTVGLAGASAPADFLTASAWALLYTLTGQPVIDSGDTLVFDLDQALIRFGDVESVTVQDSTIASLSPPYDYRAADFSLVLNPGQSTRLYTGVAGSLSAWVRPAPETEPGDIRIRIEGEGIVREVDLPFTPEHWQHVSVKLDAPPGSVISFAGRGSGSSSVDITHIEVLP
jgi:hypothetical protein